MPSVFRPTHTMCAYGYEQDSYVNGDFVSDTAVMVAATVSGSGSAVYDTDTCSAGPQYPMTCSNTPFV